ncbi:TonB-dependent receptor [Chitinophaga nivalis]|uniref:TonB-dependent receptor n=1 Tax=Chitinophaga nivalis TaxID=2991709 RepID=A0ABT3IFF2_9BACT|nr:TonB-dependent receptor [Chitinophaga nivalis]MCW3467619.1 TonB-dependent receptor [Chitinophaga nivalis]MCW3482689.1 TonB-dependent receptor [Chitinophaga nivalis]
MKLTHHLRCTRHFFARCYGSMLLTVVLYACPMICVAQQNYTVQIEKGSLEAAIVQLRKATGAVIAYNRTDISSLQVSAATYNGQNVEQLLKKLITGLPVHLQREGSTWVLLKGAISVEQTAPGKPGRIKGQLIDEINGEPVAGATVRIGDKGIITDAEGNFSLSLPKGSYTATVSYIGYGTKEISSITIRDNQTFDLPITLKRQKGNLASVVVTASANKESIASFYTRQKNAATVTDGISFEQLNKLPDNNVGATLKRISGVAIIDNKYVVVRGMTERYNQAMLDGMVLPSTDANKRNFAFDLIPNEMVSEILVNKTATPDASAEFVGGQVMIKTLDIPSKNFTTVSVGGGSNSQTIGNDFYGLGKRQAGDYLAVEGGNRKIPDNTVSWTMYNQQEDPLKVIVVNNYKYGYEGAIEQSKRFNPDGFRLYKTTAYPALNFKYIMGRVYQLNTAHNSRMGFTGGLTYRNHTQTDEFMTTRALGMTNYFPTDSVGNGKVYNFNTIATVLLNAGFSTNKHKISIRNLYSRSFSEDYYRSLEFNEDMTRGRQQISLIMPVFTNIRQHKLEGEHQLTTHGLLVNWSAGFARMNQQYNDVRSFQYGPTLNTHEDYYQKSVPSSNGETQASWSWPYRMWSDVKQTDYTWSIDVSQPFLKGKSLVKMGYTGWNKQRSQSMQVFKIYTAYRKLDVEYLPYHIQMDADHVGVNKGQTFYWGDLENGDQASSGSEYHAVYMMLDQKIQDKLRLVYGIRAENFGLANQQLAELRRIADFKQQYPNNIYNGVQPVLTGEKNWNFLPAANITYSITSKINLRVAYSKTMIRPTFRETTVTSFPDPALSAVISGGNISSTKITNKDIRFEWYPGGGDMLSVSAFHKYLDKPVELVVNSVNTSPISMSYKNQHAATNKGLEMEFRKNLAFISTLLKNVTLYGNGAYFISRVETINMVDDPANPGKKMELIKELERPLMGQSPYLINLGLGYEDNSCSGNIVFNRTGYRPNFAVDGNPAQSEFRAAYSQLDLQISKKLFHNKAAFKLNITNLLNREEFYYRNAYGYKVGTINGKYQIIKLKYLVPAESYFPPESGQQLPNYSYGEFIKLNDNYSENQGDQKTYSIKRGIGVNLSFTYNF